MNDRGFINFAALGTPRTPDSRRREADETFINHDHVRMARIRPEYGRVTPSGRLWRNLVREQSADYAVYGCLYGVRYSRFSNLAAAGLFRICSFCLSQTTRLPVS